MRRDLAGLSFFEFLKKDSPRKPMRIAPLLLCGLLSVNGCATSVFEPQQNPQEPTASRAASNYETHEPNISAFSLDTLLNLESLGDVRVSPAANIAAIDVIGAYDNAASYQRALLFGKDRSSIWLLDLTKPGSMKKILSRYGFDAAWSGPFSPDGARLVTYWIEQERFRFGIYDLKQDSLLPLDGTPELDSVYWLGNGAVIASLTPNNDPPFLFDINRKTGRQLPDAWRAAVKGDSPTGQLLEWPSVDQPDAISGAVVHYDVADGAFTSLATGAIASVLYSSDQQRVLFEISRSPTLPSEFYVVSLGSELPHAAKPTVFIDEEDTMLNVVGSTLHFSSNNQELLFQASFTGEDGEENRRFFVSRIEDDQVGKARKVINGKAQQAYYWGADIVFAQQTADGLEWRIQYAEDAEHRSVAFPGQATVQLVALRNNWLYFLSKGDLLKISKFGDVKKLGPGEGTVLKRWDKNWPYSFFFGMAPASSTEMAIPFIAEEGPNGPLLLVLDLDSGELRTAHQFEHFESLEFFDSITGNTMLIRKSQPRSPTRYKLSHTRDKNSGAAENAIEHVLELNHSLEQIDAAFSQTLRYEGLDDENLTARLLLPKASGGAAPFPMVVLIYPGPNIPYTDLRVGIDPEFSFFHEQILPAHGYALLKPNIPLGAWEEQREPAPGMSEVVISAVQSAIETGLIDEERVVLMGTSYGGYSTQVILTQTDQFAGGISMAGFNNLSSLYGVMDIRQRFQNAASQPDFFLSHLAERGQLRMRVPPWQDPERYRQNSPIFSIENIQDPLLLIHGDLDYVPIAQSEAMFTSMARAKKPVQLLRYWGEGHTISSPANIRDAWGHVFRWLEAEVLDNNTTPEN